MDQGQQYNMYGHGYSGPGTQRYKGGDFDHEHWTHYPPERHEAYENKPMVSPLAHTHHGSHTGRCSLPGEVPSIQASLEVSPFHNPYAATSSETSDKDYAYSGNVLPQGIASSFGSTDWELQDRIYSRSQDCGAPDTMQARSEPISHPGQRCSNPISPYGSNTDWRPSISPTEQVSATFNIDPGFSSPEFCTTCANCRNPPYIHGVAVYHRDQGYVDSPTDWRFQEAKLRPSEGSVPSNRQVLIQGTGRTAPHNDRLDVPCLEQPKSRFSPRKSAAANAPDNPVIVHADEDGARSGLTKKRKRKPRTNKPRKPRTLTNEGKAHAKAVRECPGGACADCKRKKTKARDPPVTYLDVQHAYNRT